MDTKLFELMADWGYYLLPKAHAGSPGYPGVYVSIRQEPTQQHFDPEIIETRLCNGRGDTERRRLGLTPHGRLPEHVCPGRLTLIDRFAKRTDFYTFGARMRVEVSADETIYVFTSSAPILLLAEDEDNFPEQLEAEAEAALAEIHVAWHANDAGFYQRLGQIEPAQLYAATLRSIQHRYTAYPALHERFPRFYARIYSEVQWQVQHHPDFNEGPSLGALVGVPVA